jgi:hypothetical protein
VEVEVEVGGSGSGSAVEVESALRLPSLVSFQPLRNCSNTACVRSTRPRARSSHIREPSSVPLAFEAYPWPSSKLVLSLASDPFTRPTNLLTNWCTTRVLTRALPSRSRR